MDRLALAKRLRVEEDCRDRPYDDATGKEVKRGSVVIGNVTIGVGRNLNGNPLNDDEIMFLLENDIKDTEKDLDDNIPWWRQLSEARQIVVADMCFNMGISGLMLFHRSLEAMRTGRYSDAAAGMRQSLWASQVGNRADNLIKMMEQG